MKSSATAQLKTFLEACLTSEEIRTSQIALLKTILSALKNSSFLPLFQSPELTDLLLCLMNVTAESKDPNQILFSSEISDTLFDFLKDGKSVSEPQLMTFLAFQLKAIPEKGVDFDRVSSFIDKILVFEEYKLSDIKYYPALVSLSFRLLNSEFGQSIDAYRTGAKFLESSINQIVKNFKELLQKFNKEVMAQALTIEGGTPTVQTDVSSFFANFYRMLVSFHDNKAYSNFPKRAELFVFCAFARILEIFCLSLSSQTSCIQKLGEICLELFKNSCDGTSLRFDKLLHAIFIFLNSQYVPYTLHKLIRSDFEETTTKIFEGKEKVRRLRYLKTMLKMNDLNFASVDGNDFLKKVILKLDFNLDSLKLITNKQQFLTKNLKYERGEMKKIHEVLKKGVVTYFGEFSSFFDFESERVQEFVSFWGKICDQSDILIDSLFSFFRDFGFFVNGFHFGQFSRIDQFQNEIFVFTNPQVFLKVLFGSFMLLFAALISNIKAFTESQLNIIFNSLSDIPFFRICTSLLGFDSRTSIKIVQVFQEFQTVTLSLIATRPKSSDSQKQSAMYLLLSGLQDVSSLSYVATFSCWLFIRKELFKTQKTKKISRKKINFAAELFQTHQNDFLLLLKLNVRSYPETAINFFNNYVRVVRMGRIITYEQLQAILISYSEIFQNLRPASQEFIKLTRHVVQILSANLTLCRELIEKEVKSGGVSSNPVNVMRRALIFHFSLARSESIAVFASAVDSLRELIPILHNSEMIRENDDMPLAENDEENVSIPNALFSIIYENRMLLIEGLISYGVRLASDNDELSIFIESNFGSVKERKSKEKLLKVLNCLTVNFEAEESRSILEDALFQLKQMTGLVKERKSDHPGALFANFSAVVWLLLEAARADPKILFAIDNHKNILSTTLLFLFYSPTFQDIARANLIYGIVKLLQFCGDEKMDRLVIARVRIIAEDLKEDLEYMKSCKADLLQLISKSN